MSEDPAHADPPPRPPEMPDAAECCGEGCVRCVFDVYDEALERYQRQLHQWRLRNPGREPDEKAAEHRPRRQPPAATTLPGPLHRCADSTLPARLRV